MKEFDCDVAVCGGGIAGLWAMHALRARGFHPVLLERHTLGGLQTLSAQGILHGGMKYALDGKVDDIALRLREMPRRWLDAMDGQGEIDLTKVQILSENQYMWSDGSLSGKVTSAMGARMMHGEVEALERSAWPAAFRDLDYRGTVRVLKETVIDVRSAVRSLAEPLAGSLFQAEDLRMQMEGDHVSSLEIHGTNHDPISLRPRCVVFTAGIGNEDAAARLPIHQPATQRRPLRQMLLRGPVWKLYGHCLEFNRHSLTLDPKPRVTITSHTMPDGTPVWYLGGNIAEKACKMNSVDEAIQFTRHELAAIFPKVRWQDFPIAAWDIDRAEPHQSLRFMPSEPTVSMHGNCMLAWPTKLVFAPGLATRIVQEVVERFSPLPQSTPLPLPSPNIGQYPWELADWKS